MNDRVNIPTVSVDGATKGPKLLLMAGVHGDEFEPMAAVRRLVRQLEPARLCGTVTCAPCVNESAFRCNARVGEDGLDLARVCPGAADGALTRRTAHAVSELIQAHDFLIDLHTGGTFLTLFPLAGYMLHPNTQVLQAQRVMARAMGLPLVWGTTPQLQGRTLSVARDANIPAIYAEFGGGGGFDENAVDAYASGCMNVLCNLSMYDRKAVPGALAAHTPIVIEDNRDGAGFLQVQHPAPADGFFEPACKPGDRVKAGDPVGQIVDALGNRLTSITANGDGLVVMLRTWRHVRAGDGLMALASEGGERS